MPWRDQLGRMLGHHREPTGSRRPGKEEVRRFLQETVAPALNSVAQELARHGRDAEVETGPDQVSITVYDGEEEEFYYAVKARTFRQATFAFPEMTFKDDDKDVHHRAMVYTQEGSQDYGIMGYEKEQVIANFMHEYDRQLRWQKPTKHGS
jgi:choline/glycine/proline betaine transport protein